MWWAGVAWRGGDFDVAIVDGTGREVVSTIGFTGRRVAGLVELLRVYAGQADGGLGTVIESTNGVVDGHVAAAGLRVYRADPWQLPGRPTLGSVPADVLARCGVADPAGLHELTVDTGTLAGRGAELVAGIARSAGVERDLIADGRYLARGSGKVPEVAITFDDGPDPRFTPQVLDILRRYRVKATFFCVGLNVAAYPDLVRRAVDEGHLVSNHTWSHPYLPDLSRDELLHQVDATNEALVRAGGRPAGLIRPPYGARNPEVLAWLAAHGLTTVVWDVDANDWSMPGVDAIVAAVSGAARAGSIILMHDAGGDRAQTVAALPAILEGLLERGLRLVAVDRLDPAA